MSSQQLIRPPFLLVEYTDRHQNQLTENDDHCHVTQLKNIMLAQASFYPSQLQDMKSKILFKKKNKQKNKMKSSSSSTTDTVSV